MDKKKTPCTYFRNTQRLSTACLVPGEQGPLSGHLDGRRQTIAGFAPIPTRKTFGTVLNKQLDEIFAYAFANQSIKVKKINLSGRSLKNYDFKSLRT